MKAEDVKVARRSQVLTGDKIEVECDGEVLAWCYVGDEYHVEKIADMLSSKGVPRAAERVREIAQEARRPRKQEPGIIERAIAYFTGEK